MDKTPSVCGIEEVGNDGRMLLGEMGTVAVASIGVHLASAEQVQRPGNGTFRALFGVEKLLKPGAVGQVKQMSEAVIWLGIREPR